MARLIIRTKKEILEEIKKISKDSDNFTYDNYGGEIKFDDEETEKTLKDFVNWLINKKFKRKEVTNNERICL